MTEKKQKSDRQNAAYLARKFLGGGITKRQFLDSFPNYDNDIKILFLYKRIMEKPKKSWFFGVSKEEYEQYIAETYEVIEDLESDKLRLRTMKSLFRQLWLQSNNCTQPIQNMGIQISEVSKMTYSSSNEILRYLNLFIEKKIIIRISDEPLLYEFTESGKKINTDSEIEEIILKDT
jgi:hypothetical protein